MCGFHWGEGNVLACGLQATQPLFLPPQPLSDTLITGINSSAPNGKLPHWFEFLTSKLNVSL